MDINCLLNCAYQKDGKCALQAVPSNVRRKSVPMDCDCVYFEANAL